MTTQTTEVVAHRNSQISVLETRRANTVLKPFVTSLTRWNIRAAFLRGLVAATQGSDDDGRLARVEARALLAKVCHTHSEFRSAIESQPHHSRLDDVKAAFERLIDQLQSISADHGDQ